jgi:hypothetical protein
VGGLRVAFEFLEQDAGCVESCSVFRGFERTCGLGDWWLWQKATGQVADAHSSHIL